MYTSEMEFMYIVVYDLAKFIQCVVYTRKKSKESVSIVCTNLRILQTKKWC